MPMNDLYVIGTYFFFCCLLVLVLVELQREGFSWQSSYFLARVTNEGRVTRVTLMQTPSSRWFEFLLLREHIDRSHRLVKRYRYLLSLLLRLQATRQLLVGQEAASIGGVDVEDPNLLAATAASGTGNDLSFVLEEDGVLCRVRLFPDSLGCLVTAVIDPSSSSTNSNSCSSILGSGLEVLASDREELNDGDTAVSSLFSDNTAAVEHKLRLIQASKSYLEICKRWFPGGADDEVMAQDVDAQVSVDQDEAEVEVVAAADEVVKVTEIEEVPIVTEIQEAPIVTEIEEAPIVTEIEEAPIVTEVEEAPIVTEIEEAPIVTEIEEVPIVTEIEEACIVIEEVPIIFGGRVSISVSSDVVGEKVDSAGEYEGGAAEDPSSPLQVGEVLEESVDDDKKAHSSSAEDDKEVHRRRAMDLKSDLDDRRRKVRVRES
jgi:hypothetical protein